MLTYLEMTYGPVWAYLLGWAQTIIYFPATIAAQATIRHSGSITACNLRFTDNTNSNRSNAFLIFMNILGSKTGEIIQTLATIGKLITFWNHSSRTNA